MEKIKKYCYLDTNVINKMMKSEELKSEIMNLDCELIISKQTLLNTSISKEDYTNLISFLREIDVNTVIEFNELLKCEERAFKCDSIITDIEYVAFNINDLWDMLNVFIYNEDFITKKRIKLVNIRKNLYKNLLKANSNYKYNKDESIKVNADNFVMRTTNNAIRINQVDFYNEYILPIIENNLDPNMRCLRKFKSWKMMLYLLYYKYKSNIKLLNDLDIEDISMSSCYPYMDYIIVDGDKLDDIKNNHDILEGRRVYKVVNGKLLEI